MKKIINFNDFLVNMLLESDKPKFHGVTELPFIMSKRLKKLLGEINHPIAKKLLSLDEDRESRKMTFVDIDEEENNKFTIVNSNKAYDNALKQYGQSLTDAGGLQKQMMTFTPNENTLKQDFWSKNRVSVKIGSFIGKVFPKEYKQSGNPGSDIESFVHDVTANRISSKGDTRFKIVKGEDIIKYYNVSNYDTKDEKDEQVEGSPLAHSCMRNSNCENYIKFYAENKDVSMLILFSDVEGREEQIVGRSIIWELSTPEGRTFMDRIYYRYESDMALFKQYAQENNWLYKQNQNMDASTPIIDPSRDEKRYTVTTVDTFKTTEQYPYMDTMKWFNTDDGYLTNNAEDGAYFLEDISGGYSIEAGEDDDRVYIDYYGDSFDEDDVTYCELGGEYRTHDDAIYIEGRDEYATEEYVNDNLSWSDYEDRYLDYDDAVYSDYREDYLRIDDSYQISDGFDGDSIESVSEVGGDFRTFDDLGRNCYEYENDGTLYYFDVDDMYEFQSIVNVPGMPVKYKHKVWDKDKIFKWKGEYHYEWNSEYKDKLIGQKRLDL